MVNLKMRGELAYSMIPIVQDNIHIDFNPMTRFISSNGYYGFHQPVVQQKENVPDESMNVEMQCNDDNCGEKMEIHEYNVSRLVRRKRAWEYGYCNDLPDFKKRRENELPSNTSEQPEPAPSNRNLNYRHPTHNIPDMPRCMMGHCL